MRLLLALAVLILGAPAEVPAAAFQAKVKIANVEGEKIAWYERGSGPPLIMAIGTGSTMAEWDPAMLALLARERRLIMFDYPGVGKSSKLKGGVTFAGLADTTAAFIRAIGLQEADVLGWSMGGFVAQQLAIRHPERVRRLILAGTNPGGDQAVLGDDDDQDTDSDPDPSDAAVIRVLYPRTKAGRAEGRAFLRRLETASESGEIPDDFDVPASTVKKQVAAEDPWLASNANASALKKLRVPTLVSGGNVDPVTPPINARRIAALIPGAKLELYPGSHAFLFGDRAQFVPDVEAFLSAP